MDDLISRKDAVKYMANTIWHYPNHTELNVYENAEELAKDGLANIPSAESTGAIAEAFGMAIEALKAQEWIPCNEKLPEIGEKVLVCRSDGAITDGWIINSDNNWLCAWNEYYEYNNQIIAWMPLPEPYSKEQGRE